MKKVLAALLVLLLGLGAGAYYFHNTYLIMNEEVYRRDLRSLNLSGSDLSDLENIQQLQSLESLDVRNTGLTIKQYEQLQALLPKCEIFWQVPFQGAFLELDTRELTITSITAGEMEALVYLKDLRKIDATACADLDGLVTLGEKYPNLEISYVVPINGQMFPNDTTALELMNADCQELMTQIKYLPELKTVTFTGIIPGNDAIYAVKQAYPQVEFLWDFDLLGVQVNSGSKEIDLSGIAMESVEAVESSLKYFNGLEKVVMCDTGLPSEEIDAMWKRNPETRFIWNVKIGNFTIRTDATTLMAFQYGYDGTRGVKLYDSQVKEMKYLVDMVCMDLGHMGLTNVSFLESMTNLEYLIIADMQISDLSPLANLKKLKYLEVFANHVRDMTPLAGCTALEDLNICHNWLNNDITPLLALENLNNIWIAGHHYTAEEKALLEEAHPDAKIVWYMAGSTGNGWRSLENYFNQRDLFGMFYMTDDGERYWERKK